MDAILAGCAVLLLFGAATYVQGLQQPRRIADEDVESDCTARAASRSGDRARCEMARLEPEFIDL